MPHSVWQFVVSCRDSSSAPVTTDDPVHLVRPSPTSDGGDDCARLLCSTNPRLTITTPLIDAAKEGDPAAWRKLYDRTAPAVRMYFRARRVGDPDDLVGQVFMDVARNIGDFAGDEDGFRGWVFTIAHRRWVDLVRMSQRRPTLSVDKVPDRAAPQDVEGEALASVGAEHLIRVIDELSSLQRSVILLRVLGDLSHAEIARALGKSEVAVKVTYHRAIKSMRSRLSKSGITGPESMESPSEPGVTK